MIEFMFHNKSVLWESKCSVELEMRFSMHGVYQDKKNAESGDQDAPTTNKQNCTLQTFLIDRNDPNLHSIYRQKHLNVLELIIKLQEPNLIDNHVQSISHHYCKISSIF